MQDYLKQLKFGKISRQLTVYKYVMNFIFYSTGVKYIENQGAVGT